jgi:polyribonucleotide nucleotidyltransferase
MMDEYPYTVRVVSDIQRIQRFFINGYRMCWLLALMDAGVPVPSTLVASRWD